MFQVLQGSVWFMRSFDFCFSGALHLSKRTVFTGILACRQFSMSVLWDDMVFFRLQGLDFYKQAPSYFLSFIIYTFRYC